MPICSSMIKATIAGLRGTPYETILWAYGSCSCSKQGMHTVFHVYIKLGKYYYEMLIHGICINKARELTENNVLLIAQLNCLRNIPEGEGWLQIFHAEFCTDIDHMGQRCGMFSSREVIGDRTTRVCSMHTVPGTPYSVIIRNKKKIRIREEKKKAKSVDQDQEKSVGETKKRKSDASPSSHNIVKEISSRKKNKEDTILKIVVKLEESTVL
jgi:hypothetical protein